MKRLILAISLITLCGCESISKASQAILNPENQGSPNKYSEDCPEKPVGTLDSKNVEQIVLGNQEVKKSGNIRAGKYVGYNFKGQSGQKLSYSTNENLCFWVYTPDNQLLNTVELPQDGRYTIQVSTPKGSTTFDLKMKLVSSPIVTTSPPVININTNNNTNNATPPSTPNPPVISHSRSTASLSQNHAIRLVGEWLAAKPRIFSHPWDKNIVYQLTTGPLYEDVTKSGGSIDWLRRNNSYYLYRNIQIRQVWSFSNAGYRPELKLSIYEDRTLYGPRGVDYSQSGSSTRNYIYFFAQDNNGTWKIYDYRSE